MTSRQRFTHTEDYSQTKSFPPFNTAQERARYLVFTESTAEKMKTMLASHIFMMGNTYFREAKPSIDKEQKKEARVFRLLRAAEARNHLETGDSATRSWGGLEPAAAASACLIQQITSQVGMKKTVKEDCNKSIANKKKRTKRKKKKTEEKGETRASQEAKEINHLISCQQTAIGTLRLEAFLLPRKSIKKNG